MAEILDALVIVGCEAKRQHAMALFGLPPRQVILYNQSLVGRKYKRAFVFPAPQAKPNVRATTKVWLANILKHRIDGEIVYI